jgi:hypothetical protein
MLHKKIHFCQEVDFFLPYSIAMVATTDFGICNLYEWKILILKRYTKFIAYEVGKVLMLG